MCQILCLVIGIIFFFRLVFFLATLSESISELFGLYKLEINSPVSYWRNSFLVSV